MNPVNPVIYMFRIASVKILNRNISDPIIKHTWRVLFWISGSLAYSRLMGKCHIWRITLPWIEKTEEGTARHISFSRSHH